MSPLIHDEAAELLSRCLQNAQSRCGVHDPHSRYPEKTAQAAKVLAYLWGDASHAWGNHVARPMQEEGGTYAIRRSAGNQQLRAEYLKEFNAHMEDHLLKCLPETERQVYLNTLAQCRQEDLTQAERASRMQEVLKAIISRAREAANLS